MLRVVAAWLSSDSIDVYRQAYNEIPQRCKEAMTQGWEEVGIDTFFEARRDPKKRRIVLDSGRAHINDRPNQAMTWGIEFSDPGLAFDAIDIALEQQSYIDYQQWWLQEDGSRLFRRDPRFAELANRIGLVEYWREFGWPSGGTCTPFGDSFICDK